MHIFVYGTLKQGQPRHQVLLDLGAEWMGDAKVAGALLNLGPFPAAVHHDGGAGTFMGEVYSIPEDREEEALAMLDRIEGHPDLFERCHITVSELRNVVAYFLPTNSPHLPEKGARDYIKVWPVPEPEPEDALEAHVRQMRAGMPVMENFAAGVMPGRFIGGR